MHEYTINEAYQCWVKKEQTVNIQTDIKATKTNDVLIKQGQTGTLISYPEHPEFMKLRAKLIDDDVLEAGLPPGVSNSDLVRKDFRLNGVVFIAGETFPIATLVRQIIESRCENGLPDGPVGKEYGGPDCEYE